MTNSLPIDYAPPAPRGRWQRLAMRLGVAGCVTGAAATALPLWPLWGLYYVPVGTSMRPMALYALLVLCAATALFISLPLNLACLCLGWRLRSARWLTLLGVLISISGVFLDFAIFNWIISMRHFVLKD